MKNKAVLLVDHLGSGHHEMYIKYYIQACIKNNYEVWLIAKNCTVYKKYADQIDSELFTKENVFEYVEKSSFRLGRIGKMQIPFLQSLYNARRRWKTSINLINKAIKTVGHTPDLVFFMWLDSYLASGLQSSMVDIEFKINWSGIYLHPNFTRINSSIIQKFIPPTKILDSVYCKAICLLDEGVASRLSRLHPSKNILILPDITDVSRSLDNCKEITKIIKLAKGKKIVSLLGSISRRKGLIQLLKASDLIDNTFFLIKGEMSENNFSRKELSLINYYRSKNPNKYYINNNKIISEDIFNQFIYISDLVYLVYINFPHSSNIMTKAAYFQKPILVANAHLMYERVLKYNTGYYVNLNSSAEIAKKISNSLINEQNIEKSNFQNYYLNHSFDKLFNKIQLLIYDR